MPIMGIGICFRLGNSRRTSAPIPTPALTPPPTLAPAPTPFTALPPTPSVPFMLRHAATSNAAWEQHVGQWPIDDAQCASGLHEDARPDERQQLGDEQRGLGSVRGPHVVRR